MKITVVTPLIRTQNVAAIWANLVTVFHGQDWQWMPIIDRAVTDDELEVADDRILPRSYRGGSRWQSSIARNMAHEIESGWIVNLDDDCMLTANAGTILRMVSPDVSVVTWQTIDANGMLINYPSADGLAGADTNAFAYQRHVLQSVSWECREDADAYLFNRLRKLWPIAYFGVPGAYWNVNR